VRQHAMKMGIGCEGRAACDMPKPHDRGAGSGQRFGAAITQARFVLPGGHAAFSGDRFG
jgi:hypothetical protein